MKNSHAWFQFASRQMRENPSAVSIEEKGSPLGIDLRFLPNGTEGFALGLVPVSEKELPPGLSSGVPSSMIQFLDSSMRQYRRTHPTLPLAAYLKPEAYWTRGPAWLLGEYLAERDLILWVDLLHLHPERSVAWVGFLLNCGLACARTFIRLTHGLGSRDFPLLAGTGTWLIRDDDSKGVSQIHQL